MSPRSATPPALCVRVCSSPPLSIFFPPSSAWASTTSSSNWTIWSCPSSTGAPSLRGGFCPGRHQEPTPPAPVSAHIEERGSPRERQVHRRLSRRRLQHHLRHPFP